jgi:hypothetical protein
VRATLHPITREAKREDGEIIRQFDLISALEVMGAVLGTVFLVLFLAAFLPWLLVKGTTAAVEGLMSRIGFGDFSADTIWSWLLVLVVGAAFVLFLVAVLGGILALYNVFSRRTGYGLRLQHAELPEAPQERAVAARSKPVPDPDATFDELYAEAQRRELPGRSSMSKAELEAALKPRRRPRKTAAKRSR